MEEHFQQHFKSNVFSKYLEGHTKSYQGYLLSVLFDIAYIFIDMVQVIYRTYWFYPGTYAQTHHTLLLQAKLKIKLFTEVVTIHFASLPSSFLSIPQMYRGSLILVIKCFGFDVSTKQSVYCSVDLTQKNNSCLKRRC